MSEVPVVTSGNVKRERLSRSARREKIIESGLAVFGEHGFRGASMTDVAVECGVAKGLLYEHYSSKEELYDACVEQQRAALFESLALAVEKAETDPLRNFATVFYDYIESNRDRTWILYGEASAKAANEMRARNSEVVAELLVRVLGPAISRLGDDKVSLLASGLVGQGEHLARWWLASPELDKQTLIDCHYDMSAGAIAAVVGRSGGGGDTDE